MKQEVYVIGRDLRDLVPFSLAFAGPDYAVTLVEAPDVVRRAAALAQQHQAWYLLVLNGDEDPAADACLADLAPLSSIVIEDGGDPVIVLAHLIAATRWETAAEAETKARSALKAQEQYG